MTTSTSLPETVSITVVTRNRAAALDTLLTQLRGLFDRDLLSGYAEILVFDDASSDGTVDVCVGHCAGITVLQSSVRVGLVEGRRRLGLRARGQYLLQLDDDSHPLRSDALDQIRATFREHPRCAVIAGAVLEGSDSTVSVPIGPCRSVAGFIGCGVAFRAAYFPGYDVYPRFLRGYGAEEFGTTLITLDRNLEIYRQPALPIRHLLDPYHRDLPTRRGQLFANEVACVLALYPLAAVLPALLWKTISHFRYSARGHSLQGFIRAQRRLPSHLSHALQQRRPVRYRTLLRYYALRRRRVRQNDTFDRDDNAVYGQPPSGSAST